MLYPKILPAKSKYVDLHAAISIAYILDKTRDNFKLFALEQLLVSFIADQQTDWEPDWDLAAALSDLERCSCFSRMINMILMSSSELVAAMEKYN